MSAYNGAHREMPKQMLDDAYCGEFEVVVCWAADRVSRAGSRSCSSSSGSCENATAARERAGTWLNGSDAATELQAAVGLVTHQEGRAEKHPDPHEGLERRRSEGSPSAVVIREPRTRGHVSRGLQAGVGQAKGPNR